MKKTRVKANLYKERVNGAVVFEIPGKKVSYTGILEKIAVDDSYVPKIHVHEKSKWCLMLVRPWFNRYTLYYGNYMKSEAEAKNFLAGMQRKLQTGVSVEEIVQTGFQDAIVYLD